MQVEKMKKGTQIGQDSTIKRALIQNCEIMVGFNYCSLSKWYKGVAQRHCLVLHRKRR